MKTYQLTLNLLSPALVGSGDGHGALIDADVILDDMGLPVIPAKRVKGCLRDAAREVHQMLTLAGVSEGLNIDHVFGRIGECQSTPVYFSSLTLADYDANRAWLQYLQNASGSGTLLSRDQVIDFFTEIRRQTRIDPHTGVALKGSLRTSRILRRNLSFTGTIDVLQPDAPTETVLALACLNFRQLGTRRHRGLGRVCCTLSTNGNLLDSTAIVEELCTS